MKKILLLIFALWSAIVSIAQTSDVEKNAALQLVSANRAAVGLSADALNNTAVSSSYFDQRSGATLVYLQQTYKGIPVYNQLQVLSFKNDKLITNLGDRIAMSKLANGKSTTPSISAEGAVAAALREKGFVAPQAIIATNRSADGLKFEFGKIGMSKENVTAELMWIPSADGKSVNLGWSVFYAPTTTSDMWSIRIDANDNHVLDVKNFTVYCNWDEPNKFMPAFASEFINAQKAKQNLTPANLFDFKSAPLTQSAEGTSPSIVNGASYLVIGYPTEAPSFGAASLKTDPWNLAGGNAVSLKWHSNGTTDYNISRGNNVWAKEDRANNNGNSGLPATSSTPDPLTFNFPPDYTVAPTTPAFQQFAITNLFYWNNIMHDVSYNYGFNEAAANFQDNNQGRGGTGGDWVYADAQDGGGTNNANFATPADGSNGRMQMYLFTVTSPQRDGDVDNGVISHEYGHGISHRLTGGPAGGAGCLSNSERGDEGWSDYFALMVTTDWSTAVASDGFNKKRPMGTYVEGQPTTGAGIRRYPYCTNMAVNPWTYSGVQTSGGEVHDIGEIWCVTIWDMTWDIIQQQGIQANLFNAAGTGGNQIAMNLVITGEKLQKCSPGFLDARDAILAADQLLYGGAYHCIIVKSFARRGMGLDAIQGSSGSTSDQTQGFSIEESALTVTESVTQQNEGQNVTYTNTVKSFCGPLTNYLLTDTIPTNVGAPTGITGGGTYNAANRVVSWVVNMAAGATNTYSFTVQINAGAYFPPTDLINEPVAGPAAPAGWTAQTTVPAAGTPTWVISSAQFHSAPSSMFGANLAVSSDMRWSKNAAVALGATPPVLSFWGNYNTEPGWDGGVVEISTNGGTTWTDLGSAMTLNGYNGTLGAGTGNNLANRAAFTGNSNGWLQTKIDLRAYPNANALFRFRCGSDDNTNATGWYVDDILLRSEALVNIRSSLFNASNVRVKVSDTVTVILPPAAGCPVVTSNPSAATVCATSTATFSAAAAGTGMSFVWQQSTTGVGGTYTDLTNVAPYSGVNTTTLTINPTTLAMNGYAYRLKVTTAACTAGVVSTPALLTTVAASVGGTITPASTNVCGTTNSGTLTLAGNVGSVIRWESASDAAFTTPVTIANTTNTYTFTNVAATTYYRAVVQASGCTIAYSSTAVVTFTASLPMVIVADPGTTLCQGDPTRLTVYDQGAAVPVTVNRSSSNTVVAGNGVSCGTAATTAVNSYWRVYPFASFPAITGDYTINSVTFGVEASTGGPQNVTVVLWDQTGAAFPGGTRTVLTQQTFSVGNLTNQLFVANFTTPVTVTNTVGRTVVVEIRTAGATNTRFFPGANTLAESDPSYISSATCGIVAPVTYASIGFPGTHIISFMTGTVPGAGGIVTGGTFLWSPAAGLSSTTTNPVAASPAVTTTYTVNHNNGAGCIRQANITITVNQRPAVTTQPSNVTVCAGQPASFTAVATGTGATYQWEMSTTGVGGTYTAVPAAAPYGGTTTQTLTISAATIAMNGNYYRLAVSGTCPPVAYSTPRLLTVNALPVVTITPATTCGGVAGINATLLTATSPTGTGFTWAPVTGLYTNPQGTAVYTGGVTATVYAAPTVNTVYTATATNTTTGCVGTGTATVNFTPAVPTITPAAATICLTTPKSLQQLQITSSLGGSTTTTYSSGTVNVAVPDNSAAGAVSTFTPALPAGAVVSSVYVTLNMSHTYPGDMIFNLKAPNGKIANLYKYNSGNATGASSGVATWGWYGAKVDDAGTAAFSSIATAPFTYNATPVWRPDLLNTDVTALGFPFNNPTGYVSNATALNDLIAAPTAGAWTLAMADGGVGDVGTLSSWSLTFTYSAPVQGVWSVAGSSPAAYTGLYSDALGTIAYTGTPANIVYASPAATTTYQVTVANPSSATCISQPKTVVVTVNTPISITTQPTNKAVCTNNTTSFTIVATGSAITHNWQVSTNSGNTWTTLANGAPYSGVNTATLTITAPPLSMNNYFYRDSLSTSPCGSVISAIARLTVNPLPTVVLSASPYTKLLPGLRTTLTASSTPAAATYTWYRNGALIAGSTATQLVDIDGLGTYKVTVQDVNGCVNTSNEVLISDSTSGRVFIYPNPTSGVFQVRYYSGLGNTGLARGMNIMDDKGARVLTQSYTINAPYAPMNVNMSKFSTGTYWVEVVDMNGNRLAMGRVIILR